MYFWFILHLIHSILDFLELFPGRVVVSDWHIVRKCLFSIQAPIIILVRHLIFLEYYLGQCEAELSIFWSLVKLQAQNLLDKREQKLSVATAQLFRSQLFLSFINFVELIILLLLRHVAIIWVYETQSSVESKYHDKAKGHEVVPTALSCVPHAVHARESLASKEHALFFLSDMLSIFV